MGHDTTCTTAAFLARVVGVTAGATTLRFPSPNNTDLRELRDHANIDVTLDKRAFKKWR
jgi:hypothetical protein